MYVLYVSTLPCSGAQDDTLKDHLMEDLDYSLVPEGGWNKLLIWYGLAEGSRPIARKVIEWGMYVKHLKVRRWYSVKIEVHEHGCPSHLAYRPTPPTTYVYISAIV